MPRKAPKMQQASPAMKAISPMAREPNGRTSRSAAILAAGQGFPGSQVKRLRDAALRGMADAEWGTALGLLFLNGKLTGDEYAAGKKWARTIIHWQMATGLPTPSPKSPSVVFSDRAAEPDLDSDEGQRRHRQAVAAIEAMTKANTVLKDAGAKAVRMVRSVCEDDLSPSSMEETRALCQGLSALARLWNLTESANKSKRQK